MSVDALHKNTKHRRLQRRHCSLYSSKIAEIAKRKCTSQKEELIQLCGEYSTYARVLEFVFSSSFSSSS